MPPGILNTPTRGRDGMSIIFQDDFTSYYGSRSTLMPDGTHKAYPDSNRWATSFWPGVDYPTSHGDGTNYLAGNYECQFYSSPFLPWETTLAVADRYDPFTIHSDGLHIRADLLTPAQQTAYRVGGFRRFGSGIISTYKKLQVQYGNIKVVAKVPSQIGTWPAIWLLPVNHSALTEIDMTEVMSWGIHMNQTHTGLIRATTDTTSYPTNWYNVAKSPSDDFATYGMVWDANEISMFYNGVKICSGPTPASMHQSMYLMINLAIGGKWVFNEMGVLPIDGTDAVRLSTGADLIQPHLPAEMIVKEVVVESTTGSTWKIGA